MGRDPDPPAVPATKGRSASGDGSDDRKGDHRWSRLLVLLVLAASFAPWLGRGHVVFPLDNAAELGVSAPPAPAGVERVSNAKFSDQARNFVPEIHHHLTGARSGWITTWNPHVGLGRPSWQFQAFGRAFVLTHLLSWLTDDAFRLATWLVVAAVIGCAVFGYGLLQALGLRPAACAVGALGLSLGVFVTYWLTFMMFVWGVCWTLGLLWAVTCYVDRRSLGAGLGVVFAVHALLLSAYPQQAVWGLHLTVWVTGARIVQRGGTWSSRGRLGLELAALALAGLASTAPAYLDLWNEAARSARLNVRDPYFLSVLPTLEGWRDVLGFLTRVFDAFWYGNPIQRAYPGKFSGPCWGPLACALIPLTLLGRAPRRLWPWQVFLAFTLVATLVPAVYRFGVNHLGLSLSRFLPLAAGHVPAMVLAACGADLLLSDRARPRVAAGILATLPLAVAGVGAAVGEAPLDGSLFAVGLVLAAASLGAVVTRKPALLLAVAVAGALFTSSRLVLSRPRGEIVTDSPLVEELRRRTARGSRFAKVGAPTSEILPANEEALLGLRSVHTYDSLSSQAYQEWTDAIRRADRNSRGLDDSTSLRFSGSERRSAGVRIPVRVPMTTALWLIRGVRTAVQPAVRSRR